MKQLFFDPTQLVVIDRFSAQMPNGACCDREAINKPYRCHGCKIRENPEEYRKQIVGYY